VDYSVNKEVAVYAMTALDQILLKTPDALLNGETLIQIVKHCVPDVSDTKLLVEPDINTLMLAIRVATSGSKCEHTTACPNCKTENTFELDLSNFLEGQSELEISPSIILDDELEVFVRPFNFEQRNMSLLNELEENKAQTLLQNNNELSTEQQAQQVSKLINDMTVRLFDLLTKSVIMIKIIKTGQEVSDPDHIHEFIQNISKSQADAISNKVRELNRIGVDRSCRFKCESCGHDWDASMDFDPISFFD